MRMFRGPVRARELLDGTRAGKVSYIAKIRKMSKYGPRLKLVHQQFWFAKTPTGHALLKKPALVPKVG